MESVSARVREVVERDPLLLQCLSSGLASVSAVARHVASRLAEEGEEASLDAVKMAVSRLARRLRGAAPTGGVERVLARSAVGVHDRVAVAVFPRGRLEAASRAVAGLAGRSRFVELVESESAVTVMVAEEDLDRVLEAAGEPLEVIRGQSAVVLVSPREIMETPGVVSYVTGFLAALGVNITQIVSSYVDTIIVVDSGDAPRVYAALHGLVEELSRRLSSTRS